MQRIGAREKPPLNDRPHENQKIHVEPITSDLDYVTEYAFKATKNGRVDYDDILILPLTRSELPS
jgi:hypothetical protein